MANDQEYMYKMVSDIIKTEIANMNLLRGDWQLGQIHTVINSKKANVFVNGSKVPEVIPCNPDVTFQPNDHVFVNFINGDPRNKFVLCRRAV